MKRALKLTTYQWQTPRRASDGLRIGVTRRPPRGVRRRRWQSEGYFDVWLPVVAPSMALLRRIKGKNWNDDAVRRRFFAAYDRELRRPQARYVVELLARLALRTPISLGCFCEEESRCHRSRLRRAIEAASA